MSVKTPFFPRGWPPVILWMAVIFGLSSMPGNNFPNVLIPGISSIAHAIEYSVLGALLLRGFMYSFPENSRILLAFYSVSFAILFGFSDEWHQTFVPGRFCELEDLIVDAISAVLGTLLYIRKAGPSSDK